MPTYTIIVREQTKRRDGTYPVSIRLTHNRKSANISTGVYVQRSQIKRNFTGIKDAVLYRSLSDDIIKYADILMREYGTDLSRYSAKELAETIMAHRAIPDGGDISFSDFCQEHINLLYKKGRNGCAMGYEAVLKNLIHFFGRKNISVREINVKNLQGFIDYLSKPRRVSYIDKRGRKVTMNRPACKMQTIKDYLADVQTLFNAACDKYNDEDLGAIIISHNPFRSKKLRLEVREEPTKRDLTIEEVAQIVQADDLPTERMQLARDVLLISFYLMAMNTADIYGDDATINIRRIQYHRQKTRTRRKDEAMFSVKIEPELLPLLRKYRDPNRKRLFNFYKKYSDFRTFNAAVNAGAKALAAHLGWEHTLTSYYMRHAWATIASEDCELSDEEVALALNHISADDDIKRGKSLRVTRGYIHRRFKKNDANHRKVLDLLASKLIG